MGDGPSGRISQRFLQSVLSRVETGGLVVEWPDGSSDAFGSTSDPFSASVTINDVGEVAGALARSGSLGLATAYIDGAWDSPDLAGFLELVSLNVDRRQSTGLGSAVAATARKLWDLRPTFPSDRPIEAIGEHYDLGNDFYARWLDSTMTYSSAVFDSYDDGLEAAQGNKYQRLCDQLELQPGDRILEIGCGWGGFAEYAASHYDVTVTGITLSREMARYATDRLEAVGMADRTTILVQDFKDVDGSFDKVVSIEMIESVDETQWPALFETIGRVLRPGGIAAMQVIVIDDKYYENLLARREFIKTYVFPGGALPTVSVLEGLCASVGLAWAGSSSHGFDYAETLRRWEEGFNAEWPEIQQSNPAFDERFKRMWSYYLAYCQAGFRTGLIDGIQFSMVST